MTKRIFITATNTNIGKTYTTKLLLKEFTFRGIKKPIETRVLDGYVMDGKIF
jgi:dethiobiotin synthetase